MAINEKLFNSRLPIAGAALLLSASTFLGGCVVRVASPPPPPRVYVRPSPPPPPAYEPAVDVEVQANEAPPPLPDYEQPPCPEEGYIRTPAVPEIALCVDAGLRGGGRGRFLLGSGNVGPAAASRCAMDARLLGLL